MMQAHILSAYSYLAAACVCYKHFSVSRALHARERPRHGN